MKKYKQANQQSKIAETAYAYFCELSKIPRGSGNQQSISDYLVAFGKERNLETMQDEARNVLIKKSASKGREDETTIVLQAHMDMVCEKNGDIDHDFLNDPIIPIIENDWVYAQGTTLGADNGAGLAIILAVLDAKDLSNPPIEAVITTDEETSMIGAFKFDITLLKGKHIINLDSEMEGVFTVSCAAGSDVDILISSEKVDLSDDLVTYKLLVKGLKGGHSGMDINKGLANANILLAQLLDIFHTSYHINFYVSNINGGSKRNAIPRECAAVISFTEKDLDIVKSAVMQTEAAYQSEYPKDKELKITIEAMQSPKKAISKNSLQNILKGILQAPNGVQSMSSEIEGLVQASNNIGAVITEKNTVTLLNLPRSSSVAEQAKTIGKLKALADLIGARVEIGNEAPAWPYKPDSPLRDKMIEVFKEMYGEEPKVEAVHAGLECGIFVQKMPSAELISIGPEIQDIHSPNEKMLLSSFNRTCDFLVQFLTVSF